ncbi:FG-GAP-like repeat-containing protein, partial [Polycladomyces subterraneus]|uniref:FG-GAP-like repeat-containing protein n=1 Tax=Polycladomyces subterraneus TaxID=1016997 RepID=UPI003434BB96
MTCPSFFQPPTSPFSTGGSGPFNITTADFNGDGKPDLAVTNQSSDTVSVFLGNGAGGFTPAPGSPFSSGGNRPTGITTADFNGDGKPDLAVTNANSNTVSVFLGNGAGGFTLTSSFSSGGVRPNNITTADFNGDGKPDLAVTNFISNTVSVFLGNGAGGFSPAPGSPFASGGTRPQGLTTADFNGDGKPDLALTNANSNTVSVFLGNGTGGFTPAPGSPFASGGNGPIGITTADFNGDGKPDLAVTNESSNTVSVFIGNGAGGFALAPGSPFASGGSGPIGIVSANLNCNGIADLTVTNQNSNNVSILIGNGNGTFQPAVTFSVGSAPIGLTSADFNGDGRSDLATANFNSNNVTVLINNCVPVPTCPSNITVRNDPGQCGAVVNYPTPTSNCPGVTVTCSPPSGSFFPVGTTTVTCTASDGTGNTESCAFTVTVQDTEPPTITCPANITVSNDPGECGAFVTFPDPTVTDNCPGATATCTPASGTFFPV